MRVVNDRRSSTRVTVRGEALVHTPAGAVRCRCLDLSPSGMSLVSAQAIKPRQRVRIESSFKGQRLVLEGQVVRRSRSREGHVLGVRFEGLDPRAREQLGEVVRSMQLQAALAMQACAIVDRLPALQVLPPEVEPRDDRAGWGAQGGGGSGVVGMPQPPGVTVGSGAMPQPRAPVVPNAVQPAVVQPRVATMPSTAQPPAMPYGATPSPGGSQPMPSMGLPQSHAATPSPGGTQEMPAMGLPQSRAATPSPGGTQEMPAMGPPRSPAATPSPGGTQEMPAMSMPLRPPTVTPGGTQEVPAVASPRPRVVTPSAGGPQQVPPRGTPRPRLATPRSGGAQPAPASPRPRLATPSPSAPRSATPSPGAPKAAPLVPPPPPASASKPAAPPPAAEEAPASQTPTLPPEAAPSKRAITLPWAPPPTAAQPQPPAPRPTPPASTEPARGDSTMVTPPGAAKWPGGQRLVGLEEGWTEDELVTTHYRPSGEISLPRLVRREPPPSEPASFDARALEDVGLVEAPDAADRTEVEASVGTITVPEAPLPDWEVGAPAALAELVDTDAGSPLILDPASPPDDLELELELDDPPPPPVLDRTMLTPRPAEPATFSTPPDAADAWLSPVRTGKTMVVHVRDLIAAYAPPPEEPELDLPEDTAPATAPAPTTVPRLSDELQAALDRLRRRDDRAAKPAAAPAPARAVEEPAPEPATQPPKGARRHRRRATTDVYAAPRREDTQVRALYHAALARLSDPDRGDGS